MDSIYWALMLALTLFTLAWVLQSYRAERREVKRYKAAAVKYRQYVTAQKEKLITDLVERLKLRDTFLPNPNVAIYSKVTEIYDDVYFMPFETPIEAVTNDKIYWKKGMESFDDSELFVLWFERILTAPRQNADLKL